VKQNYVFIHTAFYTIEVKRFTNIRRIIRKSFSKELSDRIGWCSVIHDLRGYCIIASTIGFEPTTLSSRNNPAAAGRDRLSKEETLLSVVFFLLKMLSSYEKFEKVQ
jgi:hypothetical protein